MSNYTKTTNFAAKDSLPSGNAAKIVKGAEIDTEFNNIATASATKADIAGPTFTGTVTIPTVDLNGGAIDGTTVGATTAAAITGTTIVANTSINIAGDGATVTGIKDEDDMSSNSATKLATQQSIKAYVDSQVTAQDLDVTDGSTSIDIDLDSESLGILGGTGIDSTASGTGVTLAIDATVATLAGTQTLSNKTLSTPVVSGNLTTDGLVDGRDVATDGTKLDGIESGATADQTAAEIKTAYESNADTNAFTDADESKLDGIEASADVTDTANVTAAGALMDSELTSEASVKALNQGVATTDSPTFAGVTAPVTGNVTGNLTGNVTGNVTGNLTGDVTGDVTGDLTGSVLTAAQTNITSVGNLTSLQVIDGDFNVLASEGGGAAESLLIADVSTKRVGVNKAAPSVSLDIGSNTDAVHVPTGTTAQRPTGAAGYFRYNSSLEQFEGYTTEWGSIGGGGGTNTFTTDSFTGNGSTTAYALSQTVSSEDNLLVFIEGVFQQQDAYSIATAAGTTTLTFSSAPANNNSILIYSVAAGVSGSNLNIDSMTGDGSDVTLTLTIAPVNENNTQVFIDGVYQNKSTYSISGTTLTFSTAPPNGSAVEVMTMTQTDINVPVDGTITSAKLSGDLVTPGALDVTGTVTADALTVDTNTLVVDATNNRVGIGTSSPTGVLTSYKSSNGDPKLGHFYNDNTGSAAEAVVYITNSSSVADGLFLQTYGQNGTTAGGFVQDASIIGSGTGASGGLSIMTRANADMRFYTNGHTNERMRIDASGNVGIGTSSPTYALSVNSGSSTVPALLESTGADSFLLLKDTNTTLGNVRLGSASNSLIAYAGGSERMRIDSSGNLLVGTTNATFVSTGRTCFEVNGSTNSIINLADESSGSKESKFYIHNDSSNGFITHLSTYGYAQRWYTGGSEKMRLREGGSLVLGTTSVVNSAKMSVNGNVTTFVIHPAVDNNFDCGHPSYRWDDIRATNGTIQTSDRNEKQDIEALSDAEQRVAVAAKSLMRKFRWISSVEAKGDDARIHFGIIAQDLQAAFTAEGLDAGRYAMFISDTWTDDDGNEQTRLGVRYSELLAFIISAI